MSWYTVAGLIFMYGVGFMRGWTVCERQQKVKQRARDVRSLKP